MESNIGLTEATKASAWMKVQSAIADNLFAQGVSDLQDTRGDAYDADRNDD